METVEQSMEQAALREKKCVRWGTVSVLEFRVGYNASTVPESGGPPVGLVGRPTRHSYSMLPAEEDDAEASDSECESVDSDAEMLLAETAPLLTTGRRCLTTYCKLPANGWILVLDTGAVGVNQLRVGIKGAVTGARSLQGAGASFKFQGIMKRFERIFGVHWRAVKWPVIMVSAVANIESK
ncbi:hypothetical protein PHYSODRAFT_360249 [Phytophthora sojae]|uniref:Uncharacterized protein n=1 Tax=Phytophthora sojae (strain P6497) TaxID=1094619 RepID=G4Z5R0_PHYSP|nr:hypothetical protein PHYSODRAFT_360249 [Phytophthora sojae]EGZ22374.1 hypothetical protein PHYSODRAFT_360249 [Phytophthora sojae]|eukprot:XP_009525091.1 hypothetical protein PHYSODRAFT_360249 [Phytophthora sojae]